MKKCFLILLILLALTTVILAACLTVSHERTSDVKQTCTQRIFYALHTLEQRLGYAVYSGTYDTKESEQIQYALASLDSLVCAAEDFYASSSIPGNHGFADLADALGSSYSAKHNNDVVESILFDGTVAEKELEFLTVLWDDVKILMQPMLAEDELNLRHDLTYEDIRTPLAKFLTKWGLWSNHSDAPYELLNVE